MPASLGKWTDMTLLLSATERETGAQLCCES